MSWSLASRGAVALAALAALPLGAHHSGAAEYDASKLLVLTGTVTAVDWMNPHVHFHMDVKAPGGSAVHWYFEMGSPNALVRQGWLRETMKPGDVVTVEAYAAKDYAAMAKTHRVKVPDGRWLYADSSGPNRQGAAADSAQPPPPAYTNQTEGDWVARNFRFHTGESLPELRLHYIAIGKPARDSSGHVNNAVLILHGTGGTGSTFLRGNFGGQLFGPGQPLDARSHFLILPDSIGHGKSTKPSDGLHGRFPHYDYEDMVRAEFQLVREGLQVNHLRLVMGTSMGAMHTWVWGYLYPDAMDALMPLASAPVEIAGRNRMFRAMIIQAIREDPDWKGGEYTSPPVNGLIAAQYALLMMTSSPLQLHKTNPTPNKADAAVAALRERARHVDANDMLYQFEASRDYNPEPHLREIRAPLLAINSADDEVNPPELGQVAREIEKVPHGRYVLIPTSDETRGHGTHSQATVWKQYLVELLASSEPRR